MRIFILLMLLAHKITDLSASDYQLDIDYWHLMIQEQQNMENNEKSHFIINEILYDNDSDTESYTTCIIHPSPTESDSELDTY